MDRRTFLSTGAVALCSPLSRAWADKNGNAAEHYRNAFLLIPKRDALRATDPLRAFELYEAENQLLDGLPAAPISAVGWDLIKRSEPALRELSQGAALKNCDWGANYFAEAPQMELMMGARQLAKLACLRASYSFQQKKSRTAIADLAASVKMGRDLGRRGPFIATLIQIAIENSAIDVAAAYLPRQNAKMLKAIAALVEEWRQTDRLSEAMQGEKAFLLEHERPRFLNKSPKEAFERLREHEFIRTKESDEEAKAILEAGGGTIEGLLKQIDEAAVRYDELARIWDLPAPEFKPAVSAFRQKYARDNPLAVSVLPHFEALRFSSDRIKVRFAMLNAALAVVSDGPGQLHAIKDPFGDGPFGYRPFKGGFELKSKLQGKDGTFATLIIGVEEKR